MPKTVFLYILLILLLVVSAININNYLSPRKVLGAEVQETSADEVYWNNFLAKNPNYIPGWIELGRWDKVRQIDPNYLLP